MKSPRLSYYPSMLYMLKGYNKKHFVKDLMSGLIVGIVALPLAIAFGVASGVSPEQGIITAVIAGIVVAFLGGTRLQISGPTGAFIVIVYGVIQNFGFEGLAIATFIAGVLLVLMGVFKLGTIIKYIPYPIVVGFTSGIAVSIFTTQVKDIFGLKIDSLPVGPFAQWAAYFDNFHTIDPWAVGVSVLTILLMVLSPRISKKLPGALFAIVVVSVVVYVARNHFGLTQIETIGDRFSISADMPKPQNLDLSLEKMSMLFSAGVTIALLGAIVSILSATVSDGISGDRHDSNSELIGVGISNIIVPFFGGIPITGAIARTMTNVNSGGRTPISAVVHAAVLLIILLFLGSLLSEIPVATLAGMLAVVSYNMSEWRTIRALLRADRAEASVMLVTLLLTVIFNLTIAIEIGLLLAVVLFIRRVSAVSSISVLTDDIVASRDPDSKDETHLSIERGIEVYEIDGPFFFGLATKFEEIMKVIGDKPKVRILRMRNVPFIDSTGLHNLEILYRSSIKDGIKIILSGVNDNVFDTLSQAGFVDVVGKENVCKNIHDAVEKARALL